MVSLALRNKCLKLSSWKILEPFFNVQHVFAFDLALAGQLASRHLPLGISLKICRRPPESDLEQVLALLSQAGVPRQIVEDRLKRGT